MCTAWRQYYAVHKNQHTSAYIILELQEISWVLCTMLLGVLSAAMSAQRNKSLDADRGKLHTTVFQKLASLLLEFGL